MAPAQGWHANSWSVPNFFSLLPNNFYALAFLLFLPQPQRWHLISMANSLSSWSRRVPWGREQRLWPLRYTHSHTYTCPVFFTALKGHATLTRVEGGHWKCLLVARIICMHAHAHTHMHAHTRARTHAHTHTSLGGSIHRRQPLEV